LPGTSTHEREAKLSVAIEVRVMALTEKALKVQVEETAEEHWVPMSVVDLDETSVDIQRGAKGTLAVADWFAKKEGLE
jgi:hypothetical protein